jgi:hypothetical protein
LAEEREMATDGDTASCGRRRFDPKKRVAR